MNHRVLKTEVKPKVVKTLGVKRVVVLEQQSGNPPNEGASPNTGSVQGTVNEHGSRDSTGKRKGSSSESGRIEPRQNVAGEGRSSTRGENVSQGLAAIGPGVCENASQGSL